MPKPKYQDHLDRLERYWRRSTFHDAEIESITAINKRAIIRLTDMTLIVTGVTELKRCETPTSWLDYELKPQGERFRLDVETEEGPLSIVGTDIRLIRNCDMAILIPPIDVN